VWKNRFHGFRVCALTLPEPVFKRGLEPVFLEIHDALVSAAALEIARRNDVLVLAQASLAHLADPLAAKTPVSVLSSPPLCVEAVRRFYA